MPQDAEECIRLEPSFIKGYSRKGHLEFFMKDYDAALETYEVRLPVMVSFSSCVETQFTSAELALMLPVHTACSTGATYSQNFPICATCPKQKFHGDLILWDVLYAIRSTLSGF